jgi:hypothetical protein
MYYKYILIFILLIILIYLIYLIIKSEHFNSSTNIDNKPYLWQYWEGLKPDYIDLCMKTVDIHCSDDFNIVRLNSTNIKEYLPELDQYEDKINKLIIPHKVDIYRIMLLYKYGVMYMDADIITLRNPKEILNKLNSYDFVGFGCTGYQCTDGYGKPSNWLLVSKPNTLLMKNVLNQILSKLDNTTEFEYHDLGKMIIWEELDKMMKDGYKYYHYNNDINGIRDKDGYWVDSSRIFSDEKIEYNNEKDMIFLVLYNSGITDQIKKMSREDILRQDWNYTKFIKRGLN